MTVLSILGLVVAGLLLIVVAALCVPVDLSLRIRRRRRLHARGRARWLFGLVEVPLGRAGEAEEPSATAAEPEDRPADDERSTPDRKRARGRRRTSPARRVLAALRTPGFPGRLVRLLPDLVRRIELRQLRVRMRIGRDDPADTGMLWGLLGPVSAILAANGADVVLSPDFQRAVLVMDATAGLRVVPIRLLGGVLGFLLAPVTLRAGWAAARAGRR